jgi:hypothetical protein
LNHSATLSDLKINGYAVIRTQRSENPLPDCYRIGPRFASAAFWRGPSGGRFGELHPQRVPVIATRSTYDLERRKAYRKALTEQ